MKEGDFKQDHFISDDGYINVRIKVVTQDVEEREKLVGSLLCSVLNDRSIDLQPDIAVVDNIYFQNQNVLTILKSTKKQILEDIKNLFDGYINIK